MLFQPVRQKVMLRFSRRLLTSDSHSLVRVHLPLFSRTKANPSKLLNDAAARD